MESLLKDKAKVKALKKKDIPQASNTLLQNSKRDPVSEYIRDTPDSKHPKWFDRFERLRFAVFLAQWVNHKWGLTVDHGRAVMGVFPALDNVGKRKQDKFYFRVVRIIDVIGKTKQQRKRLDEAGKALYNLVHNTLGDDIKKTQQIVALAAITDLQEIGYNALVAAVEKKADDEKHAISILSTIPQTTEFFLREGFERVAEVLIGQDDPTWDRTPVKVLLLVRPRSGGSQDEKTK